MPISRAEAAEFYRGVEKEEIACPVCQADNNRILFDRDRFGMGISTSGCLKCGLVFVNPRPTSMEMTRFYREHYRKFYESIEIPTQEYIDNGPFAERAQFVVEKLKSLDAREWKTVLDIGCSEGTFIRTFKQAFPASECYGLEPDANFAQFARENSGAKTIVNSTFQEFFESHSQAYDLITLSHVLEHLLNPQEDLDAIRKLLNADGVFYVEVPNVMHASVQGIANIHLGHVLSLSPFSLQVLLQQSGFEIKEFFTEGLPAKTKSMAAICQVADSDKGSLQIQWPETEKVESWLADYQSRCCPPRKNRQVKS